MIEYSMRLVYEGTSPEDLKEIGETRWRRWMRKALRTAALYWGKTYLPKHFTGQAWHRYPEYKRRSPKNRRPLYATGRLKRNVTASARRPTVRASRQGPVIVRVPLRTDQTFKRPRGQPDPWRRYALELAASNEEELNKLNRIFGDVMHSELQRFNRKRVKRIKG